MTSQSNSNDTVGKAWEILRLVKGSCGKQGIAISLLSGPNGALQTLYKKCHNICICPPRIGGSSVSTLIQLLLTSADAWH